LARQHLALLAHQHADIRGTAVLATRRNWPKLQRPRRRLPPRGRHGVPGGGRPGAPQLDREGLPPPYLLPPSRKKPPLRPLGTTATVFRRTARSVPHTALTEAARPERRIVRPLITCPGWSTRRDP